MTIKTPGRDKKVKKGRETEGRKSGPKILCYLHLASSEQTSKRKFALGESLEVKQTKHGVIFGETVNPFSACYVIGQERHA